MLGLILRPKLASWYSLQNNTVGLHALSELLPLMPAMETDPGSLSPAPHPLLLPQVVHKDPFFLHGEDWALTAATALYTAESQPLSVGLSHGRGPLAIFPHHPPGPLGPDPWPSVKPPSPLGPILSEF